MIHYIYNRVALEVVFYAYNSKNTKVKFILISLEFPVILFFIILYNHEIHNQEYSH